MVNFVFLIHYLLLTTNPLSSTNKISTGIKLKKLEHSSHLFDPAFFDLAYDKGINFKKHVGAKIRGGIIPHHLLAAPLIAGFFDGIKNQLVETIVLLGPNHYNSGPANISVSKAVWKTLYGDLLPETEKLDKLISNNVVSANEEMFENEHAIYGITGFIKRSFPQARIIPVVFKTSTSSKQLGELVDSLSNILNDKTLVIASVDFSHYLSSDEADNYDKESLKAIKSYDLQKIISLDYENNFDSPAALYTLVRLMQKQKAENTILISNSNSAKLTNQPSLQSTTSYVTMYFTFHPSKLSIDDIFRYEDPLPEKVKSGEDIYSLIITGDVIPARSVNAKMVQLNNFDYPFEKVKSILKEADAVYINLESPLVANCPATYEGMIFCGNEKAITGLVNAGVSVANIANNHMNNYGDEGINNTVRLLSENQIRVTGKNQPAILQIKNKKFGFLGYNDIGVKEEGISWADPVQIRREIDSLKNTVDFVIVAFHWGTEYTSDPTDRQIELAHTAIDSGADLVIGNHPHWVQGIEQYNGKFITYAHGNFIFDQMWSQETREGVIGKYIFNDNGLIDVKFYPIIIEDYSQPRFANREEAVKILNRMKQSSLKLKS